MVKFMPNTSNQSQALEILHRCRLFIPPPGSPRCTLGPFSVPAALPQLTTFPLAGTPSLPSRLGKFLICHTPAKCHLLSVLLWEGGIYGVPLPALTMQVPRTLLLEHLSRCVR